MKKLSTALAVFGCVLALAACGGKESYSKEVIKDADYDAYTVAGAFASHTEGKAVEWNYTEQGAMTVASLADVAEVSESMAKTLKGKDLKGLYIYKGALIGCTQTGFAGWNTNALKNGEVVSLDGGYCVKAIACTADDLTGGYLSAQWIPDPHTACVENLTPDTFFVPTWQEAEDDNHFSWSSNPVCIGGAGEYTIVVAAYKATPDESKTNSYNFAMGLVKTAEKEAFVPAAHDHYRLVGSINSWNKDDTAEALQFSAAGVLEYTFEADAQFKVISALTDGTGTWDGAFGYNAVSAAAVLTDIVDADGNFKVVTAGKYTLTVAAGVLVITK